MDDGRQANDEVVLDHVTVVRRGRPRTWWAVLAGLGVAAGALAVTSRGDDGTLRPGLPVALGSAAAGGGAEAAAADMMMPAWVTYVPGPDLPALGGEAPAYRLRGSVDDATVRALANALGLTGEITRDGPSWSLTSDTGLLGVVEGGGAQWWYSRAVEGVDGGSVSSSGSGVACPEPAVEPDGTVKVADPSQAGLCDSGPVTTVPADVCAADATTHCGPACDPAADCGATTDVCPADARCPEDVVEPPPPSPPVTAADLPSEDEARASALALLEATGLDVDDATVTVDGPYDAWYVSVEPRLDGVPTGLYASVSVGPAGVITSAGGNLAVPERLGDYPVLDTRAAIDRANAQSLTGPVPLGGVGLEADLDAGTDAGTTAGGDAVAGEPGVADGPVTTVVECTLGADGAETCLPPELTCEEMAATDVPLGAPDTAPCGDPMPMPEPMPEPEPIEVVLVDAVPSLVMLGAVDGSTDLYLVPGYRFQAADGGQVDLPAVADEALTAPPTTDSSAVPPAEPPVTDTAVPPPPTPTTSTPPADPQPLPEGAQPEVGVGYYVDVDTECPGFLLGGEVWLLEEGDLAGWSTPHEGGTFTLDAPGHGTFVGDAQGDKRATFATGIAGDGCRPTARD